MPESQFRVFNIGTVVALATDFKNPFSAVAPKTHVLPFSLGY